MKTGSPRTFFYRTILPLGFLLLAACAPGVGGSRLWIDSPRDGASVPLGGVLIESTIGEGGVQVVDLYANDILARSDLNPDPGARLTSITQVWDPPAEGDYYLQIVGRAGDEELGRSARVNVHVGFVADGRTCAPEDLAAPVAPFAPDLAAILEVDRVSLSWDYPDGCDPGGYRVELSRDRDFADTSLSGGTGDAGKSWAPGSPLAPGVQYFWRVAPMTLATIGPYSPTRWFFTGPACGRDALVRPALTSPADAAVVSTLTPILSYTSENYGDCTPEEFRVDLSTDPGFRDGSPWLYTHAPAWSVVPGEPLRDCTQYYWRVAPMHAGEPGTFSEAYSFFTNSLGSCVAEGEETPEPADVPSGIFTQNANCRSGPGTAYPVLRTFPAGEAVELDGQSAAVPKWWWVGIPGSSLHCWASGSTIDLHGPVASLPVIAAPPTPTPALMQPLPPGNLAIGSRVCTSETYSVTLTWFDAAGNEDGYRVYRNEALIATLSAGASSYTDLPPGSGPYTYGVEAFNGAGVSAQLTVQEAGCLY